MTDKRQLLDGGLARVLGSVALSYLTSNARMVVGEARNARVADQFRRPFISFAIDEPFATEFSNTTLDGNLGWSREDLDAALKLLQRNCTCLLDWLDVLKWGFGLEVEFANRAPVIPLRKTRAWTALTDWMDPDVLVCQEIARQGLHDRVVNYTEWGPVTQLYDREVTGILRQGVADLHVHLGGLRTAGLLWLRVISGDKQLEQVPHYAPMAVDKRASAVANGAEVFAERDRIRELVEAFTNPRSTLGSFWKRAAQGERGPGRRCVGDEEGGVFELLLRERAMLSHAFRALGQDRMGPDAAASKYALEDWVDRYIFAKSRFMRHHKQPSETNPGLAAFQSYYHRTDAKLWGGKRVEKVRDTPSASVIQRLQLDDLGAYLAQSKDLRRVELRMRPMPSLQDYRDMFEAWSRVEKKFDLQHRMRVRFAIHLKRSADARSRSQPAQGETVVRQFLREIDRETALLHRFRADPAWRKHAWRVSRIDLAGRERDAPPDWAAFCMNLVRGDFEVLQELQEGLARGKVDELTHRFWANELARSHERVELSPLGVTCHAGEDFAQPIEGLYAIHSAATLLKLREGDSIGHGLAAGANAVEFERLHAARRLTQRGTQFDAFLWGYLELLETGGDASILHMLETWLRQEFRAIYGAVADRLPAVPSLRDLFKERARPVFPRRYRTDALVSEIRQLEIWDEAVAQRRLERVPLAPLSKMIVPAVGELQKLVLNRLSERGVLLEFNPSSNLRISLASEPEELPFVRIIKAHGDQLYATINTDNPGTFGTRIENEYALLFQSLSDAKFSRPQIMSVLNRFRRHGMHGVHWPDDRDPADSSE